MLKEPWVLDLFLAGVGIIFFVNVLRSFARFLQHAVRPVAGSARSVRPIAAFCGGLMINYNGLPITVRA